MRHASRASFVLLSVLLWSAASRPAAAQPLTLLDVPFLSQSEALCGGAAAAMVLRYWGIRGLDPEAFASLVDRSAAGIRTDVLTEDLRTRGFLATPAAGSDALVSNELARGRPVIALIEDRPGTFHYVVLVAWHERGVILHDPARAPHRVMTRAEFERRWEAAGRWMLVLLPPALDGEAAPAPDAPPDVPPVRPGDGSTCDRLVAYGVAAAERNALEEAERVLLSAVGCEGAAPVRELAGVRLLQRRFADVATLAEAAVLMEPQDEYAWKLLGTGRFLTGNSLGALDAWNRAGEPRLDLVRVDNLTRTRHRVVETLLGVESGEPLRAASLVRARRRLGELPSITAARLDYAPVPGGLAELRAAVVERPLVPSGLVSYAALGLTAAATREARVSIGSLTGGGDRLGMAWRFRPHRPRFGIGLAVPVPWGGVLGVETAVERQEFDLASVIPAERAGAVVSFADWATGALRWDLRAGIDRWRAQGSFATLGAGIRLATRGDRLLATVRTGAWLGDAAFSLHEAQVEARSSRERRGIVLTLSGIAQAAGASAPLDLWPAGDNGFARAAALRAHPVLDHGRLRVERLGRGFVGSTIEAQRWWRPAGRLQPGAAVFVDLGRTAGRLSGPPRHDVDVGVGARFALNGVPGIFRADLARGLRDGATSASFVYEP